MEISIRPAHATDAEAIAAVRVESWRETYDGLLPDGFRLDGDERIDPETPLITGARMVR